MAQEHDCGGASGCLVFISQKDDDINPWFSLQTPHWHIHSPAVPNIQRAHYSSYTHIQVSGVCRGFIQVAALGNKSRSEKSQCIIYQKWNTILRGIFIETSGMIQEKMMNGYCPFLLPNKHFIPLHWSWAADAKLQHRKRA